MFLKQKIYSSSISALSTFTQKIVANQKTVNAVFANQESLLYKSNDLLKLNKFGIFGKFAKSTNSDHVHNPTVDNPQDHTDKQEGSSSDSQLQVTYRLIPVADHPLFPGSSTAMSVTFEQFNELKNIDTVVASVVKNEQLLRDKSDLVSTIQQGAGPIGLPKIKSLDDIFDVGVFCTTKVKEDPNNPFAPYILSIFPTSKAKIIASVDDIVGPMCRVQAQEIVEEKITEEQLDIAQSVVFKYLKQQYLRMFKLAPDQKFLAYLQYLEANFRVEFVQDFIHMLLTCVSLPQYINTYKFLMSITREQVQDVFAESDLTNRLEKMNTIFTEFVNKLEIWTRLEEQYDFRSDQVKTQKKLEEIYESLKKHFSKEKDEKQEQVKQFLKNLEGKTVPDHIMKVINEEIERFVQMDKHHSEVQVTRSYLEYLTKLPYGIETTENFDIKEAKKILDEGHYGLDDVKKRILEFIAVGKLHNSVQGKILCFVGPPGVGKTSIGESISKALNRKFVRIALGGDRDTSTLKGFRRTYVGAVPGKIVRALKTAEVDNPVILIDEVDKMGQRSIHGDPGSALLEILDPEQNNAFTDDYLDVPIDLSKVLFLCTANMLDTMHPALLDRMEIIKIAGYTHKEKRHILDNYLLPQAIEHAGLKNGVHNFEIQDEVKDNIILNYAREPGVRSLKKYIQRICEKIAYKIVETDNSEAVVVDSSQIEDYIGPAHFSSSKIYKEMPPGVVTGLAYNEYGGSTLYIEAQQASYLKENKGGSLKVTGSLGDVMKESSSIAQSYAKNFLAHKVKDKERAMEYLETHDIHIHFPEGAVKKDGPSAGIAITTALLSLAIQEPMSPDIAMTGEISLNGKVLAIGGVKEKTLAAAREGVKNLIFPKANQKDVERLPDFIKEGLTFHFVEEYPEVFKIVFPDYKLQN